MIKNKIILVIGTIMLTITAVTAQSDGDMLVRISEIEVYPQHLDEYLEFALNVGATSVKEEPGVIAIYPMIQKRDSCQIRILEIMPVRRLTGTISVRSISRPTSKARSIW